MGKFLIKDALLGVPGWKKTQIYPHEDFCLFVVAEMFFQVALFLETSSVLKNSQLDAWLTTMVGWKRKLLGFGAAKTFILSMISCSQISLF